MLEKEQRTKIWQLSMCHLNPLASPSPPNSTKTQRNEKSTDAGISTTKIPGVERPLASKNMQLRTNTRDSS